MIKKLVINKLGISEKTYRQMMLFLVCGGLAALTDLVTYYLYLNFLTPSPSKGLSFITGATVAYFANKYFTFEQKQKSKAEAGRFAILYFITFFVNVGTNKLFLIITDHKFISLIIATGITMCCNFVGQKFFVFKK